MPGDTKDKFLIGGLAAVAVCVAVWLVLRGCGPARPPVAPLSAAPAPDAAPPAAPAQPRVGSDPAGRAPEPGAAKPPAAGAHEPGPAAAVPALPEWQAQPEVEFGPADLKEVGRGVVLDLGRYQARVGQEFDVVVRFEGPPLMIMVLGLDFDPTVVEVVFESARPVGSAVRSGIEFYADNTKGKLVLLPSGTPGMKNVNGGNGGPMAVFRMRGKAEGVAALTLTEGGAKFASGKGDEERAVLHGGDITVGP